MFASLIAAVFVVLWSTGFVVARAITPYADPNLFLLARFGGTALIFALAAVTARAAWPTGRAFGKHLVAGALLQGVYLGAGYWAVAQGLSAGVMALLGALQPLATAAVAAPLFGERLSRRGWAGAALVAAVLALALGEHRWIASPVLWASLAWGIVMLSGVSVTLLVWMVRRGDASRATALLFLAPPLAAVEGYVGFGETLTVVQVAGFVVALI